MKTLLLIVMGSVAIGLCGCGSSEGNIPDEVRHIQATPGGAINTAPNSTAKPSSPATSTPTGAPNSAPGMPADAKVGAGAVGAKPGP